MDMGVVNQSSRRGKAKATSDGSTSRSSQGRHSVSSFPSIPDQFVGDALTDQEFDHYMSGRADANLEVLESIFEDIDEAEMDVDPTPHTNHPTDVDEEAGGTTVSSHNELAMYQGVPCDYDDDDDVVFDVLGWWKRNEHMFPCLGMIARQVLSVLVSTVAVQQEFSPGGNILTDYRSCLSVESLETLVCNRDWLLARRRAPESGYEFNSEHYMNATTDESPSSEE
ncbi:unnamed protein product [Cuscuta campestris]|uniref:HAT C-terminal dimerisation domain-containing protein n=1 Tax=Cuscuta campestris TaxID=132261 RepID=A0A484NNX2_9ASTE|nr:unnamed protein product [Cuscuta campestris]